MPSWHDLSLFSAALSLVPVPLSAVSATIQAMTVMPRRLDMPFPGLVSKTSDSYADSALAAKNRSKSFNITHPFCDMVSRRLDPRTQRTVGQWLQSYAGPSEILSLDSLAKDSQILSKLHLCAATGMKRLLDPNFARVALCVVFTKQSASGTLVLADCTFAGSGTTCFSFQIEFAVIC